MVASSADRLAMAGLASAFGIAAAAATFAFSRIYTTSACCFVSDGKSEPDSDKAHVMAKINLLESLQADGGIHEFGAIRLPDTGGKDQKGFDLVVLSKRKLFLVEVKSWSGTVLKGADGSWCQISEDGSISKFPNPLEEVKERAALLESYLSRRGLNLPPSPVHCLLVVMNIDCRLDQTITQQQGLLSLEQWKAFLRKESHSDRGKLKVLKKNKGLTKDLHRQIYDILTTAPKWDRLLLEGSRNIFGEFLGFDGQTTDKQSLNFIRKSRVSDILIERKQVNSSKVLGLFEKPVFVAELTCTMRDYRCNSEKEEVKAFASRDIVVNFRVLGTKEAQSFKIDTVVAIYLSA